MIAMYHTTATQQITKKNGMFAVHHTAVANDHITTEDGPNRHQANDTNKTTEENGMIAMHHTSVEHETQRNPVAIDPPRKGGGEEEEEDANKQMRNE